MFEIGLEHVSEIVDTYGYSWFYGNEFTICFPRLPIVYGPSEPRKLSSRTRFLADNPQPPGRCILHCMAGSHKKKYGDFSWRYDIQAFPSYDVTVEEIDALEARRKSLSTEWQQMVNIQKVLGKNRDIEGARAMKPIVAEFKKRYLGTCYVLGFLAPGTSGDSHWIEMKDIPIEIFPQVDEALDFLDSLSA